MTVENCADSPHKPAFGTTRQYIRREAERHDRRASSNNTIAVPLVVVRRSVRAAWFPERASVGAKSWQRIPRSLSLAVRHKIAVSYQLTQVVFDRSARKRFSHGLVRTDLSAFRSR